MVVQMKSDFHVRIFGDGSFIFKRNTSVKLIFITADVSKNFIIQVPLNFCVQNIAKRVKVSEAPNTVTTAKSFKTI